LLKTVPPNLASFPLMIGGIFYIFDGESWTHSLHLWFHCICSAAYLAEGSLASQLIHLAICISRSSHVAHFFLGILPVLFALSGILALFGYLVLSQHVLGILPFFLSRIFRTSVSFTDR
jgi:hypothetical protein